MYEFIQKLKPVCANILLVILFLWIFALLFTSCTLSVNTFHTQGEASDVIDENQSASPTVDAKAEIPSVVPKI